MSKYLALLKSQKRLPKELTKPTEAPFVSNVSTEGRCISENHPPRHRKDKPHDWRPTPHAWLQDGELRTTGVFPDLAEEIVRLTGDDLVLQRQLLLEHCDLYGPLHFWILAKAWEKRVEALRRDHRLSKEEAEARAAADCCVLPWLSELRQRTVH